MTTRNDPSDPQTKAIGPSVRICQLNIEGISRAKSEYLSKLLREHSIDVAVIQETHLADEHQLKARGEILGYSAAGYTLHPTYGIATYIRNGVKNVQLISTHTDNNIHITVIAIDQLKIVNVYKPPGVQWQDPLLPSLNHPVVYVGDFNSHHSLWKYSNDDECGIKLVQWAELSNLHLIYDAKDRPTFKSARWNTETNPDLCYVSCNNDGTPLPTTRQILKGFPRSQHRPALITVGTTIPVTQSINKPSWNFSKARWNDFSSELDKIVRWIPPTHNQYHRFVKAVISVAQRHIPRGTRKEFIPGWNDNTQRLYDEYLINGKTEVANELLHSLDEARKQRWHDTVENANFKRSSRKAWGLLRKLGQANSVSKIPTRVTANQVANHIVNMSRAKSNKAHCKKIKKDLSKLKKGLTQTSTLSDPFSEDELNIATKNLKLGKAPGFDNIHNEFLANLGPNAIKWLSQFYSDILSSGRLPSEFKRCKIIAITKPGKTNDCPQNFRPIALLSSCYKLLEKLLLRRIEPTIHNILPIEQAGFRPHRGCEEQVLALTTHIEAGFEKRQKTGAVFVDLTAAFDTVWREGMIYKLAKLINCKKTVQLINNMLSNRAIQVLVDDQISTTKILNNGLPQGSVLAPLLFNLYISDMPETGSNKFAYADDLALATQGSSFAPIEETLTGDLVTLDEYFKKWRLTPSSAKTETCCFHLTNKEARTTIDVIFRDQVLKHNPFPKYLGVTLDRTLSFKKHLCNLAEKLKTRNNILLKLAGSTWGATATTLRITALSLVFSAAEYCSAVWLNSPHVKKIDIILNATMRIISGAIKPTPSYWLPALSHIQPPHLRRKQALLRVYKQINRNTNLPIHTTTQSTTFGRLKSRNPPILTAQKALIECFSIKEAWKEEWTKQAPAEFQTFLDPDKEPTGFNLARKLWVKLNRIRTNSGRSGASLHKWGLRQSASCDCGEALQTMKHITFECDRRAFDGSVEDFIEATPKAVAWLKNLDVDV